MKKRFVYECPMCRDIDKTYERIAKEERERKREHVPPPATPRDEEDEE